jgi:4-amino-4-deoxy-L-arabinose transferase-like glycosyltransferase
LGWLVRDRPIRVKRELEAAALVAVVLAAAWMRLYRLAEVPPGLCLDEVMNGSLGRNILNGRHEVYIQEAYGHEPLYHYFQAATIGLLGFNVWGIRLPSVLCGLALILGVWWLGRMLFDPATALVAAGGLATGWWGVFYGRAGIRAVTSPVLLVGSLIGFWTGMRADGRKRWLAFGLGGLVLGLSFYTYPAARVVFVLPLLVAGHMLFSDRAVLRARWKSVLLFMVVTMLVATPILAYLFTQREERVAQLAEPIQNLRAGDPSEVLRLTRDTLLMPFGLKGDPRYLYNLAGRPIWGLPWVVLFLGGLGLALWRWRRPAWAMVLGWLFLGLLPGMVTPDAPSTIRTIAALPAAYLLAALPVGALAHRFRRPLACAALGVVTVALVAGHGAGTWRDMVRWSRDFEAQWRYQTPLFQAARLIDADPDSTLVCVSAQLYSGLAVSSFDAALSREDLTVRWFVGDRSLLFPGGNSTCRYLYTDATWPDPVLTTNWLQGAALIESADQRPDGRPFYRLYYLGETDVARQARDWATSSGVYIGQVQDPSPLVLPVDFAKVRLMGYIWVVEAWVPGAEAALLTMWEAVEPEDRSMAIFAHLLDQGGQYVSGEDRLDVPAHTWQQGDVFAQVQRLRLPPDLAPGKYWPEVGLYRRTDGTRLPVVDASGQVVSDRALLDPVDVVAP